MIDNFIPWRLTNLVRRFVNIFGYLRNRTHWRNKGGQTQVVFLSAFHGITGATNARADLANLLSLMFSVAFVTRPSSDYNRRLCKEVRLIAKEPEDYRICISDSNLTDREIAQREHRGVRVLISMHSVLRSNANVAKLRKATLVHVVSPVQLPEGFDDSVTSVCIPNHCTQIVKRTRTRNVGIVGRVHDPKKGVAEAIDLARRSAAEEIHIWGANQSCNVGDRVKIHRWHEDKNRIFDSFDLLLSLSHEESFGLTVIEAMSCGVPCVLVDIPAYTRFADCPGVTLIERGNVVRATTAINDLLEVDEQTRLAMVCYWRDRFSPDVVRETWETVINKLLPQG